MCRVLYLSCIFHAGNWRYSKYTLYLSWCVTQVLDLSLCFWSLLQNRKCWLAKQNWCLTVILMVQGIMCCFIITSRQWISVGFLCKTRSNYVILLVSLPNNLKSRCLWASSSTWMFLKGCCSLMSLWLQWLWAVVTCLDMAYQIPLWGTSWCLSRLKIPSVGRLGMLIMLFQFCSGCWLPVRLHANIL